MRISYDEMMTKTDLPFHGAAYRIKVVEHHSPIVKMRDHEKYGYPGPPSAGQVC